MKQDFFARSLLMALGLSCAAVSVAASSGEPEIVSASAVDPVQDAILSIRQDFELRIRPLVRRSCTACHDSHARPEGFLGHIPGIRGHEWKHIRMASRILDFSQPFPQWSKKSSDPVFFLSQIRAVLKSGRMPTWDFRLVHHLDGRLLRWYEKKRIIEWTESSELKLAQADQSKPTVAKIFQNRCIGCHGAKDPAAGLVFEPLADAIRPPVGETEDGIPYLTPGDPEKSAIFLVLLQDKSLRQGLPRMPKNADPLSDQERDLIHDWIRSLPPAR